MRPRVFPAEDGDEAAVAEAVAPASMRPRVFPAEDGQPSAARRRAAEASMRPRVFPAEDESAFNDITPGFGPLQ